MDLAVQAIVYGTELERWCTALVPRHNVRLNPSVSSAHHHSGSFPRLQRRARKSAEKCVARLLTRHDAHGGDLSLEARIRTVRPLYETLQPQVRRRAIERDELIADLKGILSLGKFASIDLVDQYLLYSAVHVGADFKRKSRPPLVALQLVEAMAVVKASDILDAQL